MPLLHNSVSQVCCVEFLWPLLPFVASDVTFLKRGAMKRRKIKMRVVDQSRSVAKMIGI